MSLTKYSENNLRVIKNFLLYVGLEEEYSQAAVDYVTEDHADGEDSPIAILLKTDSLHNQINYDIKISGSGTPKEIVESLMRLIESISETPSVVILDGAEWEDSTLMTTINAE
jgi:hypothetical protein